LYKLKKGECISYGATKNLDGDLNAPKPDYVVINPLNDRK